MVQHFTPAERLQVGQLVFISDRLAAYVGRPELARTCSPATSVGKYDGTFGNIVGITLAAIGREVCSPADTLLEILDTEPERPLGELQVMTADDLTAHALAHLATHGASPYSAMVVGILAGVLDEDEPDVSDRIQAAADAMVSL
jgi:hypothetical protein